MTASLQEQAVRERRNIVGSATLGWICCAQHIHPSGVVAPSETDRRLTETLVAALALVRVRVLDHLIIGEETAFSFVERGLL